MASDSQTLQDEEIYYGLALGLIPGIGHIYAKTLLSYNGSFKQIFHSKPNELLKTPGMGKELVRRILRFSDFKRVESEIRYMEKESITPILYNQPEFPSRLLHFNDSPFLIFKKGNADLNHTRTLGIVGTRTPSAAGIKWTNDFIETLQDTNIQIVSGFAYGIDITAHKACFKHHVSTLGVLAGGLDNIYPALHQKYLNDMIQNGAFITEEFSFTLPDRKRFPMRNRIIAALSDGIIVVESAEKGGSIITAEIAFSYNRSILAVPGRPGDYLSKGCNALIKAQKAALIEDYTDIMKEMEWEINGVPARKSIQAELFRTLSDKEQMLIDYILQNNEVSVDDIIKNLHIKNSELAAMILSLTLDEIIVQLPGNRITMS
ncbi:MAG: DNA-processing protein DprA [Saprospiraceae bacterium]|jgi:DNA processing protein|nr:DNA-processing protein DprA [Saprospiraceae bacterium]